MKRGRDCLWNANILDFQILQGNVATQLRWGGSLYKRSIEDFLRNITVKELWKLVFICRSYDQKTKWLFFGTLCIWLLDVIGIERDARIDGAEIIGQAVAALVQQLHGFSPPRCYTERNNHVHLTWSVVNHHHHHHFRLIDSWQKRNLYNSVEKE